MRRIKSAIIGCTGLVGQQFVRMLNNHPYFKVEALISSSASRGNQYRDAITWEISGSIPDYAAGMKIQDYNIKTLIKRGIQVVFSALPAGVAGDIEGQIRTEKMAIFSNASAYRMDRDVPILIPEVNDDHLQLANSQKSEYGGFIITTSNCSTAGLVMAIKPIMRFGIQSIVVSTYQAISGAGRGGVSGMEISGNILPFIKNEEEKMEIELKKILGKHQGDRIMNHNIGFQASCCRVPVREGHLESVVVELKKKVELTDLEKAWSLFSGIPQKLKLPTAPRFPLLLRKEPNRPQPILDSYSGKPLRARGMTVSIGRILKKDRTIRFFLLVHNTVRGAAGNCILNAELAVKRGLI
jgi:aspartate-semialdehyde dehydrogenase